MDADAPEYRLDIEDTFDIVRKVDLRELPGGVLHLTITTLYKWPEIADAGSGVTLSFGGNEARVWIPNLTQAYQIWYEAGRYCAVVIFVPVDAIDKATTHILKDFGSQEIVEGESE